MIFRTLNGGEAGSVSNLQSVNSSNSDCVERGDIFELCSHSAFSLVKLCKYVPCNLVFKPCLVSSGIMTFLVGSGEKLLTLVRCFELFGQLKISLDVTFISGNELILLAAAITTMCSGRNNMIQHLTLACVCMH